MCEVAEDSIFGTSLKFVKVSEEYTVLLLLLQTITLQTNFNIKCEPNLTNITTLSSLFSLTSTHIKQNMSKPLLKPQVTT